MSVVACRVTESGYEIAADSITVMGWTQSRGENVKHSKLFEVDGIVIGGVGLAEESVLMGIFCRTHKPADADTQSVVEFLVEFAEWKKDRTDNRDLENSFIFGLGGKAFSTCQYCVTEITKYDAIGAGMDYALAALHLGKDARSAVETAIELSIYCEGPVRHFSKGAE
jgi:ATP-dependent protease HslVU (ClpYQ) peptidase subunit